MWQVNCFYPVVEQVCKQILKSVFFTYFIVKKRVSRKLCPLPKEDDASALSTVIPNAKDWNGGEIARIKKIKMASFALFCQ